MGPRFRGDDWDLFYPFAVRTMPHRARPSSAGYGARDSAHACTA
jgi:hypothetical protein